MRCPHLRVLPNLIAASLSYISLCYERTNQSAFRSFDTTATCSSATDLSQKLLTFLTVIRTAWVLLTSLSLFLSASLFLHACLSIIDEKLYNGWYVGYISPVSSEWISDAMLLDMISLSTSSDKKKNFCEHQLLETRSLAIAKRPCECCIILKSGSYTVTLKP